MNLKYDVVGKDLLIELRREDKTNNDVSVPMNLTLNWSIPMKRVEYAISHKRIVGTNELVRMSE